MESLNKFNPEEPEEAKYPIVDNVWMDISALGAGRDDSPYFEVRLADGSLDGNYLIDIERIDRADALGLNFSWLRPPAEEVFGAGFSLEEDKAHLIIEFNWGGQVIGIVIHDQKKALNELGFFGSLLEKHDKRLESMQNYVDRLGLLGGSRVLDSTPSNTDPYESKVYEYNLN